MARTKKDEHEKKTGANMSGAAGETQMYTLGKQQQGRARRPTTTSSHHAPTMAHFQD